MASLFSVPRYLTMPMVGIDISDKSIRFVELTASQTGYVLKHYGQISLPSNIVEKGRVVNPRELTKHLADLRDKYGFHFVKASLPEEQAYLFQLSIPRIEKNLIRGSIEVQLEEHVPLKVDEAIFDYEILEEHGSEYLLQVSLVAEEIVSEYADCFEAAELTPIFFEIEAQGVARAVIPEKDTSAHMIVDFGDSRTGITIVIHGTVVFTTTIDIGGRMLTDIIAKNFSIPVEEAEDIKRRYGLVKSKENEDVYFALVNIVSILRDEINKHFLYWHTHEAEKFKNGEIGKIVLCGGEANMIGLADYLRTTMRVSVDIANVWCNVDSFDNYVPPIPSNDSLTYATAIGLSLAQSS